MIGILGGMGTQAGLDFCNKLALINRGKIDQQYPLFILYNKSNIPKRPENIKKYNNVLNSLIKGCLLLQKNKCKFIVMPCNTAHYWHSDLQKKIKIPIVSMPKEVYLFSKKTCKNNSKIGILCTEATLKTRIYNKYFEQKNKEKPYIININSTVMPYSFKEVFIPFMRQKGLVDSIDYSFIYNPYFVALGDVVKGLENPDLVLIGNNSQQALNHLMGIYNKLYDKV